MSDLGRKVKPTKGYLVVRPDPAPERIGLIHAPERNTLDAVSGVVAVSSDSTFEDYPEGTRLLYYAKAGEKVAVDGEEVLFLHETEVQATIEQRVEIDTP